MLFDPRFLGPSWPLLFSLLEAGASVGALKGLRGVVVLAVTCTHLSCLCAGSLWFATNPSPPVPRLPAPARLLYRRFPPLNFRGMLSGFAAGFLLVPVPSLLLFFFLCLGRWTGFAGLVLTKGACAPCCIFSSLFAGEVPPELMMDEDSDEDL